jgi:hypothetical protein
VDLFDVEKIREKKRQLSCHPSAAYAVCLSLTIGVSFSHENIQTEGFFK